MIKLTIEIEETDEEGITALNVKSDREEATTAEIKTFMALRNLFLKGNPAVIGHGAGATKEESQSQARQSTEIARAILKAGRPKRG
jgi:hypothetical protein